MNHSRGIPLFNIWIIKRCASLFVEFETFCKKKRSGTYTITQVGVTIQHLLCKLASFPSTWAVLAIAWICGFDAFHSLIICCLPISLSRLHILYLCFSQQFLICSFPCFNVAARWVGSRFVDSLLAHSTNSGVQIVSCLQIWLIRIC